MNPFSFFRYLNRNQKGQSLVEYLILTALMAVATMSVVRLMSHSVSAKFAQITKAIQGDKETPVRFENVNSIDYAKKDMSDFMTGAISGSSSGDSAPSSGLFGGRPPQGHVPSH